jgi:DNA-binding NarL/FixJ family response regulator
LPAAGAVRYLTKSGSPELLVSAIRQQDNRQGVSVAR